MELSPSLCVKIVHLVDRTDLFKISNLVYGGREIVMSLYSSLQGQTLYGGYIELAGTSFVSAKIDGLGNFLEQLTL
jgi:hypothetical protein